MHGRMKNFALVILIFITFGFIAPMITNAATEIIDPYAPKLQIDLPGTLFKQLTDNEAGIAYSLIEEGDHKTLYINWIGLYLGGLYRFGIYIAAILAIVMIMIGGFLWLTSAGNSSQVGTAQSYITSALVGLFLLLAAHLLLYTINPALVRLKPIAVRLPKEVILRQSCEEIETGIYAKDVTIATVEEGAKGCGKKGTITIKPNAMVSLASTECQYTYCQKAGTVCVSDSSKSPPTWNCARCDQLTAKKLEELRQGPEYCQQVDLPDTIGTVDTQPPGEYKYCYYNKEDDYKGCKQHSIGCKDYPKDCTVYNHGYKGVPTELKKNMCSTNPCSYNNGKCTWDEGGQTCKN